MYENTTTEIVHLSSSEIEVLNRTAKLLYLSDKDPTTITFRTSVSINISVVDGKVDVNSIPPEDPSTIYVKLPILKPSDSESIPRPDYYPSYAGLSPEQRWIYLNWLRNITMPINIGYVFIYYYGLERQLLIGNFDLAFDEILFLQDYHKNSSFLGYSNTALDYACLFRKRNDKLEKLYRLRPRKSLENFDLLLAHNRGFDLTVKNLIDLSKNITGINKRYITTDPHNFELALTNCLLVRYGGAFFPFASHYQIKSLPKEQVIIFANYSFPIGIRTPDLPNFFSHVPFVKEVKSLFNDAYESTKILRKIKRSDRKKS